MDISVLNLILALLASLCTIGGVIAVTIRYLQASDEYGEPNKWRVVAQTGGLICVILIITVLISHAAATTPAGKTIVHLGSQPGNSPTEATATANAASTATALAVISSATATSAPTAIPTETSVPDPTNAPPSVYGTQTIAPNWRLDCGGCDEPVLVTVSRVATDAGNQNMVWTFTFKNHTADNVKYVYFYNLYLVDQTDPNNNQHIATGAAMKYPGAAMTPGQSAQLQVTFAFLPGHHGLYTLTAGLQVLVVGVGYSDQKYQQSITFP